MKKLVFLLTVAFAFSFTTRTMAQTDQDIVEFNAHLLEVLDIVVFSGNSQEITFASAADYNLGVTEAGGIVPGFSEVSVESTMDWNMTIECPDFVGGTGGTETIPINNLGVWIENPNGSFTNGVEVTWGCTSAANAQALTNGPTAIISNGSGNAGDINENNYIFHWLMGTMQGNMNGTSMFDQIQAGDFTIGDYSTTATLIVTGI